MIRPRTSTRWVVGPWLARRGQTPEVEPPPEVVTPSRGGSGTYLTIHGEFLDVSLMDIARTPSGTRFPVGNFIYTGPPETENVVILQSAGVAPHLSIYVGTFFITYGEVDEATNTVTAGTAIP